jgi:predicted peroxiredoxin
MRRSFLGRLLGLPAVALPPGGGAVPRSKVLIKSAWGSADPTQASFPFHHANAFAEAGHEVQIFLLGEAVSLMRTPVANSIVPVGWPPLAEAMAKALEHRIPVHV